MIFLKLNSPWDTVPSHLTQGLYVGGPHDVVFRSELDFESERGAVTWGEIRTVLAHQGVRSPRPSEPPRSGCWPSPDPLSLALFSATAVTCMTAVSVPAVVQLQEHTPQQAVWVALPSFSKALQKALSVLLELSFLPLFIKQIFTALLPSAPKGKLHGRRDTVCSLLGLALTMCLKHSSL